VNLVVAIGVVLSSIGWSEPPPADARFDYQIGGAYEPPDGVAVVSRDWFGGEPLDADGTYSICYVNAFQTQADEEGVDRPDERSNWPADLVLADLGDDPNWEGEYVIDLSTDATRRAAFDHVAPMLDTCAAKRFDAVELDNLDSWTRFDVPFGLEEAVAYASMLSDRARVAGLAVAQKNTPQLGAETSLDVIGFDFAIAEECGLYDECTDYTDVFGDDVIVIEYTREGFTAACETVGSRVSVVLRDSDVTTPGSPTYVYDSC
jgi:hypothetical protein